MSSSHVQETDRSPGNVFNKIRGFDIIYFFNHQMRFGQKFARLSAPLEAAGDLRSHSVSSVSYIIFAHTILSILQRT